MTPDQRVREHLKVLAEIKSTKGVSSYWAAFREICLKDIWFLFRVPLDYWFMDEHLHGEILLPWLIKNKDKDTAVFLPRGHCKTLTSAGLDIYDILCNKDIALMNITCVKDLAEKYGKLAGDFLASNYWLQNAFSNILKLDDVRLWGEKGYSLPSRRPRIDPTLFCASVDTAITGKHPDKLRIDDAIDRTHNNVEWYDKVEMLIKEARVMLPESGTIGITGTRYNDGDTYGKIISGKIRGNKGPFEVLIMSCYVDDNPAKGLIFPYGERWYQGRMSGYTAERIEGQRAPESEGGLGLYFHAQMRNDPIPIERQDIKVSDIIIYEEDQLPKMGHIRSLGVETTGAKPIFNHLREQSDELKIFLPLQEIIAKRTRGESKADRIKGELEPIAREGRLYAKEWMIGDDSQAEGLGYEVRRLGAARHDDIIDALHMIPQHLSCGVFPGEDEPAHLYMSVDLAWSEEKRSDFSVAMIVAVDHKRRYWVIDYDRFQISSTTQICDRIIKFYQRWNPEKDFIFKKRKNKTFVMSYK